MQQCGFGSGSYIRTYNKLYNKCIFRRPIIFEIGFIFVLLEARSVIRERLPSLTLLT